MLKEEWAAFRGMREQGTDSTQGPDGSASQGSGGTSCWALLAAGSTAPGSRTNTPCRTASRIGNQAPAWLSRRASSGVARLDRVLDSSSIPVFSSFGSRLSSLQTSFRAALPAESGERVRRELGESQERALPLLPDSRISTKSSAGSSVETRKATMTGVKLPPMREQCRCRCLLDLRRRLILPGGKRLIPRLLAPGS
jgi:hypothetical protein